MGPETFGELMKKTLLFYTIFFFVILILTRASGFIVKILLANAISPYEYGLITMVAISIPGMLQMITNLNFYQILSHSTEGKKYFGFSVIFGILIVFIVSILLVIFNKEIFAYLNLPTEYADFFLVMIIITLLAQSIIMDFMGLFTGMKNYSHPTILMAIPTIIRLAVVAVLIVVNFYSFEFIIFIFTISSIFPFFYLFGSEQYRKHFSLIKTIEIPTKPIFLFGMAVFFISNFSSIMLYLTRIVISHDFGMIEQGYYDVSLTIAGLILFVLGTLSFIVIPEATDSDNDSIYRKGGLTDVTRALFCLIILFSIIIGLYGEFIVSMLFSSDYIIAGQYLPILTIGFIFLFIQTFSASIVLSTTKNTKDFIPLIIGGIILLPLTYFLTEFMIAWSRDLGYGNGFIGGYISTTLILVVWTLFTILFSKDHSPLVALFEKGEKMIISTAITIAIIFLLNPAPLLGICILVAVFTFIILVSGYLDIQMFRELVFNK
jgi:O-antigen/teichoic acid export membrane protein